MVLKVLNLPYKDFQIYDVQTILCSIHMYPQQANHISAQKFRPPCRSIQWSVGMAGRLLRFELEPIRK